MVVSTGPGGKTARAEGDYKQDKPYTRENPGPWAGAESSHVPQITYEKMGKGLMVTVKVNHPMDPKKPHYIMWIKLEDGHGKLLGNKELMATDPAATATFELASVPGKLKALQRCNIHGIWMNETDVKLK
ncbi:MAG: desulfoferrodoxin family protein [Deltaproteobacteria bacterium]|nr:desulfoferrodoxin family protein [Deltaproteobacteria bacterium]